MPDTKGRPPRTQGAHHLKNLTTTHFLNIEVGRVTWGAGRDTASVGGEVRSEERSQGHSTGHAV